MRNIDPCYALLTNKLRLNFRKQLSPRDILKFYRTEGPKIFPQDRELRH
jgi:hypothetical protein